MIFLAAVLALALLVSFYLLVCWIALFYLGVLVLALSPPAIGTLSWEDYLQLGVVGFVVVVMLRCVVSAAGSPAPRPGSVPVSVQQAPGLWALASEVADRFGTTMPELRLTAEPNAAMSEDARLLGLRGGRRRLYVGVPLLLGLGTDELRAVLCHEFGHCATGHTRLGAITYRGHAAIAAARRELAETARGNPVLLWPVLLIRGVLGVHGRVYDLVSLAVRRRQEVDADRAAARIAGPAVLADALRSADVTAAAWSDFRARFVEPAERQGMLANEVFSPFRAMLTDPGYQEVIARRRARPPDVRSWRDSHPTLRQRLDRLARLPDRPAHTTGDPVGLLADPASLFARVTPSPCRPGRPVAWQVWLNLLTEHDATTAALTLPVDPVTPESVLALLAKGTPAEFDVVHAVMGQALVIAGAATWAVPWTGSRRLIDADRIPDLVHQAIREPARVERLRQALVTAGADLTRPVAQRDKPKGLLDIAYGNNQPSAW